mgnify:CR=1 FL=1
MLICNLINESYKQLRKEQFGLCTNYDILYSLFNQELGLYLECTGVVLCYTPETCEGTTTTSCSLTTTQTITSTSCELVTTQSFDDP